MKMSRLVLPSYTVIRDTREQDGYGWIFDKADLRKKPPRCDGTIIKTMDTGDYTLEGYDDILCIERKTDFSELWVNYSARKTFEKEMERMRRFKYKYIIVESPICTDHFSLSIPQFKNNVPGKALVSWVVAISLFYGVHIIYAGQCGMKYAQTIFQNVIRIEKDRWKAQDEE